MEPTIHFVIRRWQTAIFCVRLNRCSGWKRNLQSPPIQLIFVRNSLQKEKPINDIKSTKYAHLVAFSSSITFIYLTNGQYIVSFFFSRINETRCRTDHRERYKANLLHHSALMVDCYSHSLTRQTFLITPYHFRFNVSFSSLMFDCMHRLIPQWWRHNTQVHIYCYSVDAWLWSKRSYSLYLFMYLQSNTLSNVTLHLVSFLFLFTHIHFDKNLACLWVYLLLF